MKKFLTSLLLASAALFAVAEDGFMSEKWNQAAPWNDFMPVFSSEAGASNDGLQDYNRRAPAGCVAIQMSQFMHYWQWPKTYWNLKESTHSVTQTYGKEPYTYSITLQPNGRVPFDYSNDENAMARLAFVCASLANMGFTSSGSGSLPETVINKLVASGYYESKGSVIKDSDTMRKYLKAGYPLLARGEGHAYILHDWQDDSKTPVYANWGWQGGIGNGWKALSQIDDIFLCYPKIMPRIDSVPTQSKCPLTITWGFPEMYCTIYEDIFDGFDVNIVPTRSTIKDDPGKTTRVGKDIRAFTFSSDDLENGKEYRVTVTPIFKGTTLSEVSAHSVEFTASDSAPELPKILSSPKPFRVKLREFSFQVTCSDAVKTLEVSPSVYSISLNNEIYCFDFDNLTCTQNGNVYTIKMNAGILPQQFEDQKVILTLKASGDQAEDYADVIVTLIPNDGEESIPVIEVSDPENPGTDPDPGTETDPKNFVTDGGVAEYILISPADFVEDWTTYVKARAKAHPELTFAVKNAAEIYSAYGDKGGDPADMIKSYIAQEAANGTKYFVLGAAWSDISTMDGKSEESFVVPDPNGKYTTLALSLANTLPGWQHAYHASNKPAGQQDWTLVHDYEYSLVDDDMLADVVISRIPLVPWPKKDGSVPSFSEIIEGYGKKVATVESAEFTGTHRYACAGAQAVSNVSRGSANWPTEHHRYADGYYDFFDSKHPDSVADGVIAARRRFRDYFAMYNPIKGAMVIPVGNTAAEFFADQSGWEAVIAKCHGLEGSAYLTGITDELFRETSTIVKFGIFAMPCLTGRPDRTTTWNGLSNLRQPSMGVAAICNPNGGEVVGFHNTHDGAGGYNLEKVIKCEDPYSTQHEGFLLAALCVPNEKGERLNAGEAWLKSHRDYIKKYGSDTWNLYTAREAVLYGDPLIKLSDVGDEKVCGEGKVPAKVLFK